MANKDDVIKMLQSVNDPELGVDIWTMGLVYGIDIPQDDTVEIVMTFTSPMCPLGAQIQEEVEDAMRLLRFKNIHVTITFDPPWKPSEELRVALGLPTK